MSDTDITEKVAAALHEAGEEYLGHIPWDEATAEYRVFWCFLARAAIEAMGSHSLEGKPDLTSTVPEATKLDALRLIASIATHDVDHPDEALSGIYYIANSIVKARTKAEGTSAAQAESLRLANSISKTSSQHMTAGGRKG